MSLFASISMGVGWGRGVGVGEVTGLGAVDSIHGLRSSIYIVVMKQVRRAVASARDKGTWRRLREKTQVHKPSPQQTREAKQTQAVHLWGEQIKEAVHGLNHEKEELAEREARKAAAVDELRAEKEACTQAAQRERTYEDALVLMNNSVAGNMMWTHLPEETRETIRARLGREGKKR